MAMDLDTEDRITRGFHALQAIEYLLTGHPTGELAGCEAGHLGQLLELVREDMQRAMPSELSHRLGVNDD